MALANTAFLLEGANKLVYGHGIVQINDAFEFIKKSINNLPTKSLAPFFSNDPNQKGILHFQNDNNNSLSTNYTVNIDSAFDKKWIFKHVPVDKNFILHYETTTDNSFKVKIATNLLEEGTINYAEINGFDSLNHLIGPPFYLPVTVICLANPN
uniref:Uncharacterized protein n=1 Tax=Panagrolaimus davidi TaxID=227884 RepID=A0A914PTY8_9BILA